MKVVFLLIVVQVLGLALAAGSGPYNPRGWKPLGPAFRLPNEDNPNQKLEEKITVEDNFKEYGPPKLGALSEQELPELYKVRTFEQHEGVLSSQLDIVKQGSASDSIEETTTTEIPDLDLTTLVLGDLKEDSSSESTTDAIVETPADLSSVKLTETQIDDKTDLLHLISEQNRENLTEKKTEDEEISGSLEGLREYGPPGFTEYSPPKYPHGKVLVPSEIKQDIEVTRRRRASIQQHRQ